MPSTAASNSVSAATSAIWRTPAELLRRTRQDRVSWNSKPPNGVESQMLRVCLLASVALQLGAQSRTGDSSKAAADEVASTIVSTFDRFDLVALGEWHGSREDHELRTRLIRHPEFPKKVRFIAVECATALHQALLDRFVAGEEVPRKELVRAWRDTTQSPVGGGDSPNCEQFLTEIRAVNRALPRAQHIRVIAGDSPLEWGKVCGPEDVVPLLRRRSELAAELLRREVIGKGQKALLVWGAAHLWRATP